MIRKLPNNSGSAENQTMKATWMHKTSFSSNWRKHRGLFFLTLPALVWIAIFSYVPYYGLVLPFKDFRFNLGFWKSPWSGLRNFSYLFGSDNAWRITWNTVFLNSCFIVVLLVVSLTLALFLQKVRSRDLKVFQTSFFLPYFVSWVVGGYILNALLDMDRGVVNSVLESLGASPVLWYNDASWWPLILTLANTWKYAGYYTIIYYTGLIGIDPELYEAASMDGASEFTKIRLISLPLIAPLVSIMTLLQVGRIFIGNFDLFYNLTRDSPLLYRTTDVIDTFVFRALRSTGDIGMASAAGLYQSVVGLVIVLSVNAFIRRISSESSLF